MAGNTALGRLDGKIAVITGATSGIGEATARRFAGEGAAVVLSGRNVDRGRAIAAEIGGDATFVAADVRREADISDLLDRTVARFGRVDCLFNNAGATPRGSLRDVTEAEFDDAMRLLLGSVVFGIKHGARSIGADGGAIINNSSIAGLRLGQGTYLYSAAKAAITHLTRLAAVELGPRQIRVNSISPGAIATPIFWGGSQAASKLDDADNKRKLDKLNANLARATPLPRAGTSDDVAAAAAYLASDDGSFVNGHDLVVDGGRIWTYHESPGN